MKEYTLLGVISVVITIILDRVSGINVLKRKRFYLFLLVIIVFKLLVNGFLTGKDVVLYNPEFFLSFRIGSIPLEDFLFGFSMVTMTIIFWEYFKKRGEF